jgi:hypothetical protein
MDEETGNGDVHRRSAGRGLHWTSRRTDQKVDWGKWVAGLIWYGGWTIIVVRMFV